MTLDNLPKISPGVLGHHIIMLPNTYKLRGFIKQAQEQLKEKNQILYTAIESRAAASTDPVSVRYTAYSSLSLIDHQLSAIQLKKSFENDFKIF